MQVCCFWHNPWNETLKQNLGPTITQIMAYCLKHRTSQSPGTRCSSEWRSHSFQLCDPESRPVQFSPEEETECLCWGKELCWAQHERFSLQEYLFTRVLDIFFFFCRFLIQEPCSLWDYSWINDALGSLWARFVFLICSIQTMKRQLMKPVLFSQALSIPKLWATPFNYIVSLNLYTILLYK